MYISKCSIYWDKSRIRLALPQDVTNRHIDSFTSSLWLLFHCVYIELCVNSSKSKKIRLGYNFVCLIKVPTLFVPLKLTTKTIFPCKSLRPIRHYMKNVIDLYRIFYDYLPPMSANSQLEMIDKKQKNIKFVWYLKFGATMV